MPRKPDKFLTRIRAMKATQENLYGRGVRFELVRIKSVWRSGFYDFDGETPVATALYRESMQGPHVVQDLTDTLRNAIVIWNSRFPDSEVKVHWPKVYDVIKATIEGHKQGRNVFMHDP